jgi:hypothetical protein
VAYSSSKGSGDTWKLLSRLAVARRRPSRAERRLGDLVLLRKGQRAGRCSGQTGGRGEARKPSLSVYRPRPQTTARGSGQMTASTLLFAKADRSGHCRFGSPIGPGDLRLTSEVAASYVSAHITGREARDRQHRRQPGRRPAAAVPGRDLRRRLPDHRARRDPQLRGRAARAAASGEARGADRGGRVLPRPGLRLARSPRCAGARCAARAARATGHAPRVSCPPGSRLTPEHRARQVRGRSRVDGGGAADGARVRQLTGGCTSPPRFGRAAGR